MLKLDETNPMNKLEQWMLINTDRPIKMSELKEELLKHFNDIPRKIRELTNDEYVTLAMRKIRGDHEG